MNAGIIVFICFIILALIGAGIYYWMHLRQKRQEDKVLRRVGEDPFAPGESGPGAIWAGGSSDYVLIDDHAGDVAHAESSSFAGTSRDRRNRLVIESQLAAQALDPAVLELRMYKNAFHKFDVLFPSGWSREEAESTEAVCVQFTHELQLGAAASERPTIGIAEMPKYLRFSISWDDVSFVSMTTRKFATNMSERLPRMVAGAHILDLSPYKGGSAAVNQRGQGIGTSHRDAYQVSYQVKVGEDTDDTRPPVSRDGTQNGGSSRSSIAQGTDAQSGLILQVWNVILLSGIGRRGKRADSHWKAFTLSFGCPASIAAAAMPLAQALVESFSIRPEARREQAPPPGAHRGHRRDSSGDSDGSYSTYGRGSMSGSGAGTHAGPGTGTSSEASSDDGTSVGSSGTGNGSAGSRSGSSGQGEVGANAGARPMPMTRGGRADSAASSASSNRMRCRLGAGRGAPGWAEDALRGRSFASESEFSFSDREGPSSMISSLAASRAAAAAAAGHWNNVGAGVVGSPLPMGLRPVRSRGGVTGDTEPGSGFRTESSSASGPGDDVSVPGSLARMYAPVMTPPGASTRPAAAGGGGGGGGSGARSMGGGRRRRRKLAGDNYDVKVVGHGGGAPGLRGTQIEGAGLRLGVPSGWIVGRAEAKEQRVGRPMTVRASWHTGPLSVKPPDVEGTDQRWGEVNVLAMAIPGGLDVPGGKAGLQSSAQGLQVQLDKFLVGQMQKAGGQDVIVPSTWSSEGMMAHRLSRSGVPVVSVSRVGSCVRAEQPRIVGFVVTVTHAETQAGDGGVDWALAAAVLQSVQPTGQAHSWGRRTSESICLAQAWTADSTHRVAPVNFGGQLVNRNLLPGDTAS